jgi:3-oxoacyl-(acyl-carrier-protein) synthase
VQFEFVVIDWAAYADGLTNRQDWVEWARAPSAFPASCVAQVPALPDMPAMMRRRVDRIGRLACQVAYWCQSSDGSIPMVFASRYGDAHRSLALLGDLVGGMPVSPAGFALSVHNAVAALYSIARGDTGNAMVVSAGRATATAALVEAAALIASGEPEVLVVCYEAPLPGHYAHFQDEMACEFAWAWRVAGAHRAADGILVNVQLGAAGAQRSSQEVWPEGLDVLRQVLGQLGSMGQGDALVREARPGTATRWRAHA